MMSKRWFRVGFATGLLALPWVVAGPPSENAALTPALWGRYSLLFVLGYAFYASVVVPWAWELLPGTHARARALVRSALYLWFCVAVGAMALEACLRVLPTLIPSGTLALLPEQGKPLFRGYFKGQIPDPELGFRLRPNLSWKEAGTADSGDLAASHVALPTVPEKGYWDIDRPCTGTLDARGYRGVVGAGGPRILFLGDSFLYCARFAAEDVWCASACRALAATAINLGVFAYGVPEEAIVLAREIDYYRPDLVVLCVFEGNDLQDARDWQEWRTTGVPLWQWESRRIGWLECSPVLAWAGGQFVSLAAPRGAAPASPPNPLQPYRGQIAGIQVVMGFAPGYLASLERGPRDVLDHPGWPPTLAGIRQCRTLCEAHNARLLVALLPSKESVYAWHLLDRMDPLAVLEAARLEPRSPDRARRFVDGARRHRNGLAAVLADALQRQGVPFLDFRPRFFAAVAAGSPQLYRAFDTHWNPAGQQMAADILSDYLAAHPQLLPATPVAQ